MEYTSTHWTHNKLSSTSTNFRSLNVNAGAHLQYWVNISEWFKPERLVKAINPFPAVYVAAQHHSSWTLGADHFWDFEKPSADSSFWTERLFRYSWGIFVAANRVAASIPCDPVKRFHYSCEVMPADDGREHNCGDTENMELSPFSHAAKELIHLNCSPHYGRECSVYFHCLKK